ncbi:MAG TPA: hypothetical protein VFV66_14345 [Nonomuraea sp.]|nr:hypothetical protein [Nonomuraea sp.]
MGTGLLTALSVLAFAGVGAVTPSFARRLGEHRGHSTATWRTSAPSDDDRVSWLDRAYRAALSAGHPACHLATLAPDSTLIRRTTCGFP